MNISIQGKYSTKKKILLIYTSFSNKMGNVMENLISQHRAEYGVAPEVIAEAPGSFNLMGANTDFCDGYVIQTSIQQTVKVAMSRRSDNSLRFYSVDLNERKRTTIANLKYKREDRWANYIKGVMFEFIQQGYPISGLDVSVTGNILQGVGLGSSAAVGVSTALALQKLFSFDLEKIQLVQSAYLSESAFIGKTEKLTDQFTSLFNMKGGALFLDVRSLAYANIPLELGDYVFIITNSNIPVVPIADELTEIISHCHKAVEKLKTKQNGTNLRDFTELDLKSSMGLLNESSRRLCLHIIEENKRVLEGKKFLEHKDPFSFGRLMNRSHESLRDNFEVSSPELDWLVKRASELDGCSGSRMIGPGFYGCTVSLMKGSILEKYIERLEEYERIFGFHPEFFICTPPESADVIYFNG